MKTDLRISLHTLIIIAVSILSAQSLAVFAEDASFLYQGRLIDGSSPANGSYDLKFALFATNQTGSPVAPILTNASVTVSSGLFTTTVNFDSGVFTGEDLWFEISARKSGSGVFTTLTPRQPITATPYAITAENANNLAGFTIAENTNGAPNVVGGSPNNFVGKSVVGATIGGGGAVNFNGTAYTNSVTATFGTVGGGANNAANGYSATVSGGNGNVAKGGYVTIGGGQDNETMDSFTTVGGGENNIAGSNDATVGGGDQNTAGGSYSTVGGGSGDVASGFAATVGGGSGNVASGDEATVAGGNGNTASGDYSFAAGDAAHAGHIGSFVWADYNPPFTFSSIASNQFRVRATGGVGIATAIDPSSGSVTAGVHLLSGDTAWSSVSDKNVKKNFQAVDGEAVLEKLASVPVEKWNYKWERDSETPHIGPMAQDFKGAFYPGRDDKSITTLEFDGVELAAIQGLNRKIEGKDAKIEELEQQNQNLARRLEELERKVQALSETTASAP